MSDLSPETKAELDKRGLIGPKTLADELGVPLATIYKWNTAGGGPRFIKVGRHVRFRRADVDAWLNANASQPV